LSKRIIFISEAQKKSKESNTTTLQRVVYVSKDMLFQSRKIASHFVLP